ncbi:serine hydrolase [Actinoplanes sp. NPDC051411]|uniref:serine hydrolase n=1 Tax=Actinoplanes sp. NPDC051411 TaxID=3155522 RepID=UPI003442B59C
MNIQEIVDEVVSGTPAVDWSVKIGDQASHQPERRLRTASVGKLLLLIETARRIEDGRLDPAEPLARDPALAVADSGLWQHLSVPALPVADLAVLVAAVSDNFATNVLLGRIGLRPLTGLAAELGLRETALLDFVRRKRTSAHPPTLSWGTAAELAAVMSGLARGTIVSPAVSARVDAWLATGVDLSMVASAFDLDPLAHADGDLRNKTGTDDGVRADVGHIGLFPYAVLANWDPGDGDRTAEVMSGMRAIGRAMAA